MLGFLRRKKPEKADTRRELKALYAPTSGGMPVPANIVTIGWLSIVLFMN
ncbi:MAG: hypothetical protein JRJ66_01535 [Deltaproteobacteria bacterium]|nr:hypothetical protein [Deltaproteobacteria bacterium]MBW2298867.1 hypothetical protein [Deltaproteobacteria bacterium]